MDSHKPKHHKPKLITSGLFCLFGIILATRVVNFSERSVSDKIIAIIGIIIFIVFGVLFLRTLTKLIYHIMVKHQLGIGRSAAVQFSVRIIGYIVIILSTLELLSISVTKLILGGAVLGIILGVAAQQSLGNFFASVVLILTHPFRVGETVIIISGSFGGTHEGEVLDIGLAHTKIELKDGQIILLPNSTLLSWAAIMPKKNDQNN